LSGTLRRKTMSRTCTICTHQQHEDIDNQLINGESYRDIAGRFSLSRSALSRHKEHLPSALTKAKKAAEISQADDLLAQVRDLQTRALNILDAAEGSGNLKIALIAIREARGNLELLGKLAGELQAGQVVNVLVSPQWIILRSVILESLEPFRDARLAVASALEGVENGSS